MYFQGNWESLDEQRQIFLLDAVLLGFIHGLVASTGGNLRSGKRRNVPTALGV